MAGVAESHPEMRRVMRLKKGNGEGQGQGQGNPSIGRLPKGDPKLPPRRMEARKGDEL